MSIPPLPGGQTLLAHCSLMLGCGDNRPEPNSHVSIDVTDHLKWARMIARGVRQVYHFEIGSQEEQDLESTAYLAIVELVERFDATKMPPGVDLIDAFRGWAVLAVRCRCSREARRLRNGGTYHTRREESRKPVIVERLRNGPDMIDPRSLVEIPDTLEDGEVDLDFY